MEAFEQFLQSYQEGIKVHYIGNNPKSPEDFGEAMKLWNRWGSQAGPHCFSSELSTASHQDVPIS